MVGLFKHRSIMASISLPPQSHSTLVHSTQTQPFDGHSRRNMSMSTPLPNPPFVFPAREPVSDSDSNGNYNPPSPRYSMASSARVPRAVPPPLPAFSFNPGSDQPPPQPSPPLAPPVNRPSGHRRRPSEFVGGDKLVSPGITSPPQPAPATVDQKNDGNSMEPPAKLPAPGPGFSAGGPGKRRHAHRRSQAVSSVDLTAISNALEMPTLGSAPCVPADRKPDAPSYEEVPRPMSHSAATFIQRSSPVSPNFPVSGAPQSQDKPAPPEGPGPAEEEQSIPSENPLETPENAPSAQQVGDIGSSVPPVIEISPSSEDKPRVRPKTADASWLFDQAGSSASGNGHKRSLSASGHSRAHKSLSSGLLDAALRKNYHSGDDSSRYSCSEDESDTSGDPNESGGSKKRSKSKARKKVRSWAGSILTRGKGKRDQPRKGTSSEASNSNTPPMITRTNSDLGSGLDVDFDDDNMVVLRTSTNPQAPAAVVDTNVQPAAESEPTLENSWKPRSFYEQGLPDSVSSAVIDLDAALGPFNTPDMRPGQPAGATSGFSVATRHMYSGGRRGEFVGPEMRYHRRTESAPEMPPFDRSLLNSNRLTACSSFENPDVFDEEEEDAFLAATSEPSHEDERRVSQAGSVLVDQTDEHTSSQDSSETVRARPADEGTTVNSEYAAGLGIQRHASTDMPVVGAPTSEPEREFSGHHDFAEQMRSARNPFMHPPRSPVEIMRQEDWQQQHRAPIPPSPDVSPRFMPADKRPATSPIELGGNIPAFSLQGAPSSHTNSAFSSPEFTGSSSDTRRSVATPSTIDRNFFHPPYNMSPDFPHASVEDVPSLTSSASTTTNPLQRFSASFFTRRGSSDRAASFSAGVNRRTSASHAAKRSSLASLSKLVVGHANERSKLSYEEKPPGDMPEKGKRKNRGIGRLMHFWRTKDKERNGETAPDEERHT